MAAGLLTKLVFRPFRHGGVFMDGATERTKLDEKTRRMKEPVPPGPQPDLTPSLVAKLRQGERESADLLDRAYRTSLIRFCVGYLGHYEEAEDVVQDVFLRVLRSETVPDRFRAWIYRIARNRCLDILRTRARRRDDREMPGDSQVQMDLTGYLTRLVKREREEHLRRILAELTANQREVLRLRYAEGLSRAEIAEVLEIPESYVKSRLYEGLEKLRQHRSVVNG